MSVEILRDGVFKQLPADVAEEVKAAFARGRRGRVKECTVIADSQLALELYKLLYHKHNITPTEEYFDRAYTGYIEYIIKVSGKVYKLRAEIDYINYCYDNDSVSIGIQKGKKITLKKN